MQEVEEAKRPPVVTDEDAPELSAAFLVQRNSA